MKITVSGAGGTVGQALQTAARKHGHTITAWPRQEVPPLDFAAGEHWLDQNEPEAIIHLATASQPVGAENEGWRVNVEWSEMLAAFARKHDIPMVFISTVMVFSNQTPGPYTPDSPPDVDAEESGYGYEKRIAEEKVRTANPAVRIARLGWQIGGDTGGNQMLAILDNQQREQGFVGASEAWLPACSFLEDTGEGLCRIVEAKPGLYQLDSNRDWNFAEIVQALKEHFSLNWEIRVNKDFVYDQRMEDARLSFPTLDTRLKTLRQ